MADFPDDFVPDEGFRSSDIEIDPPVNPHANLGKKAIARMVKTAFRDRYESKAAVKQATLVTGAVSTVVARARWANLFYNFLEVTLQKK